MRGDEQSLYVVLAIYEAPCYTQNINNEMGESMRK